MILTCHQRHNIPLQHSVAFFYRVLGISLTATAKRAGYTRGYLYMALSGERNPPAPLRQAVHDDLGINVWQTSKSKCLKHTSACGDLPVFDLSTDEVSDMIAPDLAGKQEALEIIRPLGGNRARLVLHEKCKSLKRFQQHQDREKRSKNDKDKSSLPRGHREYLQDTVRSHQSLYGPLGGRVGQSVVPALYLNDQWNRFSAWLEGRNIDPTVCRTWVDGQVGLLRAMQVVSSLDVGGADTDEKNLDSWSSGYGEYGKEGSQMLAGLFLLDNQDDYVSWLQQKELDFGRPLVWAERQAEEFRKLVGPGVNTPACQYPGME